MHYCEVYPQNAPKMPTYLGITIKQNLSNKREREAFSLESFKKNYINKATKNKAWKVWRHNSGPIALIINENALDALFYDQLSFNQLVTDYYRLAFFQYAMLTFG